VPDFRKLRSWIAHRPRGRRHDPSRGPLDTKLFRYARYNAELTREGLAGCGDIEPASVQKLDLIDALDSLQKVEGRRHTKGQGRALQA
jgi:hypothetical protein